MFLKLKYFLKTNAETRKVDKQQYKEEVKILNSLRADCQAKRDAITGDLRFESLQYYKFNGLEFCYYENPFDTKACSYCNQDAGGLCKKFGKCMCQDRNYMYVKARDAYRDQKRRVEKFWEKRWAVYDTKVEKYPLLKLRYLLKTNSAIRALDEMEYLDACEKLHDAERAYMRCGSLNKNFYRDVWTGHKSIVDNFWYKRMTARVNTK